MFQKKNKDFITSFPLTFVNNLQSQSIKWGDIKTNLSLLYYLARFRGIVHIMLSGL